MQATVAVKISRGRRGPRRPIKYSFRGCQATDRIRLYSLNVIYMAIGVSCPPSSGGASASVGLDRRAGRNSEGRKRRGRAIGVANENPDRRIHG